jgi:para-aminobenzoate synthetase component 1
MQMLIWANQFNICALLDNHQYLSAHSSIDCILAVDALTECLPTNNKLDALSVFIDETNDWIFGHLSYDLKEEIAGIPSQHPDHIAFPDLYFFQPAILIELKGNQVSIDSATISPDTIFSTIQEINVAELFLSSTIIATNHHPSLSIQPRITKADYIKKINELKKHILLGDCYEVNFCQEFFAEQAEIQPVEIYLQLTKLSPNPFACFYKYHDKYLLCASPERYLQKKNNRLISQPIKGTVKRDLVNEEQDHLLKEALRDSVKDRAENVMVVDLVRNDLSKVCTSGSVEVDELFGIYSFPQVHQMISTISGEPDPAMDFSDFVKASFPMGSMTGAPKLKVMQLIEQYEASKRGLYSGAVGYINPSKDFDFNVVIRSILYNEATQYLSYQVGGGITFYSDPEKEYEECLAKAAAIIQVLNQKG